MRRATAAAVALTLLLSSCTGSGDGAPVRIEPSGTETATAAPTASTASPVPEVTAPAPATTSTATPLRSHPMAALGGAPLDGRALWQALEAQALTVGPVDRPHACDDLGWPRSAWYATRGSVDDSQVFLLWVYSDRDALRDDWVAKPGASPVPVDQSCTIASGWRYWNENLVLVIETAVDETLRQQIVGAFLGLTP